MAGVFVDGTMRVDEPRSRIALNDTGGLPMENSVEWYQLLSV